MCERKCMCKPGSQVSLNETVNWAAKGDYAGNTAGVTTCRSFSNANLGDTRFYQGKLCVPSPLPEVLLPTRSFLFKGHLLILQNASLRPTIWRTYLLPAALCFPLSRECFNLPCSRNLKLEEQIGMAHMAHSLPFFIPKLIP